MKIIADNPAKELEYYRLCSIEKGIFTEDEENKLFFSSESTLIWESKRMYLLHRTALVTGMRLGEIIALRWGDINDSFINVQHAWNPLDGLKETKTGTSRRIPINHELKSLFEELYRDASSSEFIFSSVDGKKPIDPKTIYRVFYNTLSSIGITEAVRKERNITFHSFRHTFNSRLLESGMYPETIRLLTGHTTAGMTARYSHLQASKCELPYSQKTIEGNSQRVAS